MYEPGTGDPDDHLPTLPGGAQRPGAEPPVKEQP